MAEAESEWPWRILAREAQGSLADGLIDKPANAYPASQPALALAQWHELEGEEKDGEWAWDGEGDVTDTRCSPVYALWFREDKEVWEEQYNDWINETF